MACMVLCEYSECFGVACFGLLLGDLVPRNLNRILSCFLQDLGQSKHGLLACLVPQALSGVPPIENSHACSF